ncbi:RHS repeat protein [Xanthomonas fragariae]|nr:RHS repeat domain-containing protein [Xanthomonas fragariae]WAT14903.1 RHS repeat protein [Xanthomonas fragariae]
MSGSIDTKVVLSHQLFCLMVRPGSSLNELFYLSMQVQTSGNCNAAVKDDGLTGAEKSGAITSPAGATATFSLQKLHVGRSYVTKACWSYMSGGGLYPQYPKDSWDYAISAKTVSGPGLSQATWRYNYSPGNASWSSECTGGCASTVWTDMLDPDGIRHRSVFSNRADGSENLLLRSEIHAAGSDALVKAVDDTYAIMPLVESNSPYPWRSVGRDFNPRSNWEASERWTPILSTKLTQDGSEFNRTVNSYDVFARPVSVTRASPWHSRTDVTSYFDNTVKWILGAEASSTNSDTGLVERQATYNDNAQPLTVNAFGKLQQTLSYNNDGTLASSKDGNNATTTFASWKRGIPQSISYADGTTKSAVADDNRWITSATDTNGYTTAYGYDAMGRLASITYPGDDSTAWNMTTQKF